MREISINDLLSLPTPNYVNPVTKGNSATVIFGIFTGLVVVVVSLRAYARTAIQKWFGLDDVFILLALISTIALNCLVILAMAKYGWNRHVWDIPLKLIQPSSIVGYVSKIVFVVSITFTRLSLLSFYYRLLKDTNKRRSLYLLHASTLYVVLLFIASMCMTIFSCSPVKAYWTFPPINGQKCLNEGLIAFCIGIFHCLAELLVTIIPIHFIIGLNMPLRLRLSILALLCLGFMVTAAGIVRVRFSYAVISNFDETWVSYPLWIAAGIEANIGLICACAPALRLLLMTAFNRTMSTIGKSTNTGIRSLRSERRKVATDDGSSARKMTTTTHESTMGLRERAEKEAAQEKEEQEKSVVIEWVELEEQDANDSLGGRQHNLAPVV